MCLSFAFVGRQTIFDVVVVIVVVAGVVVINLSPTPRCAVCIIIVVVVGGVVLAVDIFAATAFVVAVDLGFACRPTMNILNC